MRKVPLRRSKSDISEHANQRTFTQGKETNPCPHGSCNVLFQELLQIMSLPVAVPVPHWGLLSILPFQTKAFLFIVKQKKK